jgi:uncharacterized protein YbjT (DUF2867 family)
MSRTILVLGSTGHVGEPLVHELARSEELVVRAGVRDLGRTPRSPYSHLHYVRFDFNDRATYAPAFEGVDAVYLVTPVVPGPAELVAAVAEEARRAGVTRIVRQSALGADDPEAMRVRLLRAHRDSDQVLAEAGLPYVILRPAGFFQNFLSMSYPIRTQGTFSTSLGQGAVSFVDARDVAAVAAVALTRPGREGQKIELTGPEALTGVDMATAFSRGLGRRVRYVPITDGQMADILLSLETPPFLAEGVIELYRFWREGHAARIESNVAAMTGFPARPFDRFVREYSESFSEISEAA